MFSHIILFKFVADVSVEQAFGLLARLGDITATISQVQAYRYGRNDTDNPYNQHYDYAFVMDFLSKQDRYIYQNHPAHLDFIETHLNPLIADAIVFDMENIGLQ